MLHQGDGGEGGLSAVGAEEDWAGAEGRVGNLGAGPIGGREGFAGVAGVEGRGGDMGAGGDGVGGLGGGDPRRGDGGYFLRGSKGLRAMSRRGVGGEARNVLRRELTQSPWTGQQ